MVNDTIYGYYNNVALLLNRIKHKVNKDHNNNNILCLFLLVK